MPKLADRTSVDVSLFPAYEGDFQGEMEAQWSVPNPCVDPNIVEADIGFVAHSEVMDNIGKIQTVWGYEHLSRNIPAPWFSVKVICDTA